MAQLRELPRNPDGTWRRAPASPFADPALRKAAKQAVRDTGPARRQAATRSPNGVTEYAPGDRRSPEARGRREQATGRLHATNDLEKQLAELKERFDVPSTADIEAWILHFAGDYPEAQQDAVLLGFVDFCELVGMHSYADEVSQAAGYEADPAIRVLRKAGLGDEDVDAALDVAQDFPPDGPEGAKIVAAAFLAEENGHGDLVDRLADLAGVDTSDLYQAINEAVDRGHLDPDELEDEDGGGSDLADDDELDAVTAGYQDDHDELADRYGLDQQDLELLADLADELGGVSLTDALKALADHQGYTLDELAQHATAAAGDRPDHGGWDGYDGADHHDGYDHAAAGEPAAAPAGE